MVFSTLLASGFVTALFALWAGLMALGMFVAAIGSIMKGFFGRATVFAVLGFLLAGAAAALAAAI